MPSGYLFTLLVLGWCTALALFPVRQPRQLAVITWWSALVVNELPFVGLQLLTASTLLAWAQGGLTSGPGGAAAIVLAACVAAGLLTVALRGHRAGAVLDRALDEGLGAGWRDRADRRAAPGRRRVPLLRVLLLPLWLRRREVTRIADVSYGDAGRHNLLDVYHHRELPPRAPVLVYVHGGSFSRGDKNREGRALLQDLAARGWVCVSINYRLQPAASFPDYLVDVKKAVAWVRREGHRFGAAPGTVFVAGSSAGGHLAAMCALTADDPAFQPGFEEADTSVSGVIPLYAWFGHSDFAPEHGDRPLDSPMDHLHADAPPALVIHGDHDTFVSPRGARRFTTELRALSAAPVVYAELPGGQHAFDLFRSLRYSAVIDAVEEFTAWVRAEERDTDEAPAAG